MRFHSSPIEEHPETPNADEGRLEALLLRFRQRQDEACNPQQGRGNPCFVLTVQDSSEGDHCGQARLQELVGLVAAQGDHVVGTELVRTRRADPRMRIGRGAAERVAKAASAAGASMLVIDAQLTPSQARNLEDATGFPICDREGVILNVFQRNARTPRARIQVELAHLAYLRPRIRGIGLNMDRQAGGVLQARGAGETASELMARRIDDRMADLRRQLNRVARSDEARRSGRAASTRVSLVGYTNAGKTALMNALSGTALESRERPFETLDTTARALSRYGTNVLLSDTVGFIRQLPKHLFESFASTLAELREASLLLLVVDVSDPELTEHLATTARMLESLGAREVPRLVVFNKADRLDAIPPDQALDALSGGHPYVLVSALRPEDTLALRTRVLELARAEDTCRALFVPYDSKDAAGIAAAIYRDCRVRETRASERGVRYLIEGPPYRVDAIVRRVKKETA